MPSLRVGRFREGTKSFYLGGFSARCRLYNTGNLSFFFPQFLKYFCKTENFSNMLKQPGGGGDEALKKLLEYPFTSLRPAFAYSQNL